MAELNDREQRDRMLSNIHRQIEYLRTNPDARPRVIGRLEALCRLARVNTQAGITSRLGQLCMTLQRGLPGQIALLKSDTNNDRKVADTLARMALSASLFVCSPYDYEADRPDEYVEEITITDDSSTQDEHDLTRIVFGTYLVRPTGQGL